MRLVDSEIIPRRVVASERTESRETLVERSDPGPPAESELRKRSRYPTSPTVKTEVTVPAAKSKLADNSSRGMRKTRHSGTRGSPDAASDTDFAQNRAFAPRNSGVLAAPPGQAAFFLPTPKTSSDSSASPNLGYDVVSGPAVGLGIMETDFFPADGYQVDGATVAPGSVSSDTSEKKSAVASKGKGQGRAKSVTIKNKSLLQDDEASSSPRPKTTRRGVHAGTPPEGPFFGSTTLTLIPLLDETGMPARLEVLAECHRAFFKEEDEGCWLIYRRNYIHLRTAAQAYSQLNQPLETLYTTHPATQALTSIVKYTAEIRAVDGSNRAVELQQGTSTRSTVLGSPKPQPLGLGGDPFGKGWDAFYDNVEVVPIISQNQKTATFYRFVFRHATPGNTSYTTAGDIANTFALIIDLLGELEDGTVVHVAQMHSQPIIVRGRSPSHYLKMKEKIIKTGCQRPRGGGGGRKKQRRARSSEEPEDEDGVSMDEAEFEADAVVKTEPLRNQVDVNSLAHALYHQVVRNAAETAAQELADAVERAASVPLPETQEQFEFAWPAQQVPSRFLDSALIPSPIATTEAIEPAGEPKEDQKSSSTGSAERLHSAASLFLQTSGSQFIDWNGGQPSSGEGEKTK